MPATDQSSVAPLWLTPSLSRLIVAGAIALAAGLLPQRIPLEWYPLNEPGTDINYLEISCAANVAGEVQIRYDLAREGHRPIDTIRIPISPTTQTYTYTFPLPDAPIIELGVRPPPGGALTVGQMRIINRRGEEIRRFPRDLFRAMPGSTTLEPLPDGWKISSLPGTGDPYARLELHSDIVPVGMNHRNLLRCLLSTSYLAMMLIILLLAVLFAFHRPANWKDAAKQIGFMLALAALFAPVGNRGLIMNSIHYARYLPRTASGHNLRLEFDVAGDTRYPAQIFYDTGHGYTETESIRQPYEPHPGLQTLRFDLPGKSLQGLRFDPFDSTGRLMIRGVRVVDEGQNTRAIIPLSALRGVRDIGRLDLAAEKLSLETTPTGKDPILLLDPAGLDAINRALAVTAHP